MKVVELLEIGREILKMMSESDIRRDDWKYVEMYADFARMKQDGEKYWYIISVLAQQYGISASSVIRILRRLGGECQKLKPR